LASATQTSSTQTSRCTGVFHEVFKGHPYTKKLPHCPGCAWEGGRGLVHCIRRFLSGTCLRVWLVFWGCLWCDCLWCDCQSGWWIFRERNPNIFYTDKQMHRCVGLSCAGCMGCVKATGVLLACLVWVLGTCWGLGACCGYPVQHGSGRWTLGAQPVDIGSATQTSHLQR
jgi:hypothetical protein